MSRFDCHRTALILAAALLLGACHGDAPKSQTAGQQTSVPAQTTVPATPEAAAASPVAGQPAAAGLREFIDPATGQHREPTAADIKALEAAKARDAAITVKPKEQEKEIVFQDGTVALKETTTSDLKGCLQKNGKVTVDHDCKAAASGPVAKP